MLDDCISMTNNFFKNLHIDDLQCSSYCVPTREPPTLSRFTFRNISLKSCFFMMTGRERTVNYRCVTSAPFRNKVCILTKTPFSFYSTYKELFSYTDAQMSSMHSLTHTHTAQTEHKIYKFLSICFIN